MKWIFLVRTKFIQLCDEDVELCAQHVDHQKIKKEVGPEKNIFPLSHQNFLASYK